MRFDIPIYFQKNTHGKYNEQTGNYEDGLPVETLRYASVSDTGSDTLSIVYGKLHPGSLIIRLQNHYNAEFDAIRIGSKIYQVDRPRKLRTKQTFVVSEVQTNAGNQN